MYDESAVASRLDEVKAQLDLLETQEEDQSREEADRHQLDQTKRQEQKLMLQLCVSEDEEDRMTGQTTLKSNSRHSKKSLLHRPKVNKKISIAA